MSFSRTSSSVSGSARAVRFIRAVREVKKTADGIQFLRVREFVYSFHLKARRYKVLLLFLSSSLSLCFYLLFFCARARAFFLLSPVRPGGLSECRLCAISRGIRYAFSGL